MARFSADPRVAAAVPDGLGAEVRPATVVGRAVLGPFQIKLNDSV